MPTDSTESNTSPETSTTVGTMQTTNNDQSTATSSSSTETEVSATLPPKTTGFTETSAEYRTDTAVTNLETTQASLTSTEPLTTVIRSTPYVTQATSTSDSPSTPECKEGDCQCQAGECKYSVELGRCHCLCPDNIYGETCSFGQNNTTPDIDTGAIPTRKADITLEIKISFLDAYNNLSSPESLDFITKLQKKLEPLCNQAEPEAFKKVRVVKLSPGSTPAARRERGLYQDTKDQSANALIKKIKFLLKKSNAKVEVVAPSPSSVAATSRAEYSYPNNQTQIEWLNTHLDDNLAQILKENISLVSQAFSNASVQFKEVVSTPVEINNITDLQPFINCSMFVNYTAEVVGDQWQCVGPCKRWPDSCSVHGECLNDVYKGAVCRCYESSIKQYYGQQCQLYRWGPGFYGALFGSIAVFLLLLTTVLAVFLLKKRHMYLWKRNRFSGFLDFEEDFFDFTDTGITGTYTPENF
ncbi:mucin-17 [Nerophis ophidion]|uniref:mucin-17 n=1 Tax=Nerophis ophidion TaxID=159077 RepID=UPI002AE0618D|nr:mucin-17 [Nerophis ophidion]